MATTKAPKAQKTTSWTDDPERSAKNEEHLAGLEEAAATVMGPIKPIILPKLDLRTIQIRLEGEAPLICHRWSEKAKKLMLDRQMGRATAGKEPKDPEADYLSSFYKLPDGGNGFPTIAFKNAAVSACTSLGKSVTKVAARQAFHVLGEFAEIIGEPSMREDMVRVGQGTADIRYRAQFEHWSTTLTIRYNARVLTDEQVVNLFNTAGFAVGVGEWRPERDGMYGRFRVV